MKRDIFIKDVDAERAQEVFCYVWLLALAMGLVAVLKLMLIMAVA